MSPKKGPSPNVIFFSLATGIGLGCFVLFSVALPQFWVGLRALLATTSTAFVLMGYDKRIAGSSSTRVPELVLWGVALSGGSLGMFLGIQLFRHKTKKASMQFVLLGIFLMQLLIGKTIAHALGIDSLRELLSTGG